VREWFEEPDGTRHVCQDVLFDELSTDEVENWRLLSSAAEPIDSTATVWDDVGGREAYLVERRSVG